MIKALICYLFGSAAIATSALAQSTGVGLDGCVHLLQPTVVDYKHSLAQTFAYEQLAAQNSSSSNNTGVGIVVPVYSVPVGINFNMSKASVENRYSNIHLNWTSDEQADYSASFVPAKAGDQFNACVSQILAAQDGKLTIQAQPQDDNALVVTISVHPSGTGGPIFRRVHIRTDGKTDDSYRSLVGPSGAPISLFIERPDPSRDLHIEADVVTITGAVIDSRVLGSVSA